MVSDLRLGAVLPPVVIGAVISNEEFKQMPIDSATSITEALPAGSTPTLSIIDGMQRTAAIIEAVKEDSTVAQSRFALSSGLQTAFER
ncbi:hypothetical protein GS931_20160 [Rhodococcus hoagii]|nr:hypothetical protein [Prescottella equi]